VTCAIVFAAVRSHPLPRQRLHELVHRQAAGITRPHPWLEECGSVRTPCHRTRPLLPRPGTASRSR
jgi:hypothetical protein